MGSTGQKNEAKTKSHESMGLLQAASASDPKNRHWLDWVHDENGSYRDHKHYDIRQREYPGSASLYTTKSGDGLEPRTVSVLLDDHENVAPRSMPDEVLEFGDQADLGATKPAINFVTGQPAPSIQTSGFFAERESIEVANSNKLAGELEDDDEAISDTSLPTKYQKAVALRQRNLSATHAIGTATNYTRASTEYYRLRPSGFFIFGRVFKIAWPQPHGHHLPSATTADDPPTPSYQVSQRRMMVIVPQETHCLCVPIMTYKYQGCKKKGLKKAEIEQHAVVYVEGEQPWWDPEETEKGLSLAPVPVKVVAGEKLERTSRVRFDHVHTVTHNMKVKHVGWVDREHRPTLLANLHNCLFPQPNQTQSHRR